MEYKIPTQYFTDSHGEFQRREVFPAQLIPGAVFIKSSDKPVTESFIGFGNAITGALSYSGQYKAFKHIAPFIDKNDRVYSLRQQRADCREMFGYPSSEMAAQGFPVEKSDGKGEAAIFVNPNEEDKLLIQFKLNGVIYYAELPPRAFPRFIDIGHTSDGSGYSPDRQNEMRKHKP